MKILKAVLAEEVMKVEPGPPMLQNQTTPLSLSLSPSLITSPSPEFVDYLNTALFDNTSFSG